MTSLVDKLKKAATLSTDLLQPFFQVMIERKGHSPLTGHSQNICESICFVTQNRNLIPFKTLHKGVLHWYLLNASDDTIIDPVGEIFTEEPDYTKGVAQPLPNVPSRSVIELLDRAGLKVEE